MGRARLVRSLIGLVFLAATPAAAGAETDSTILSLPGEGVTFLPLYVAQDQHFFEQQSLTVKTVYLAGVGTTNAVISGAADFGISNGVSLTRAAAHGQNLLAMANMSDRPGWSLVMRKDVLDAAHVDLSAPLPQRLQILKGHSFAIDTLNSLAHAYLRVLEKIGGIDPDAVPITPVQPQGALAVLNRKALDGFVSNSPFTEMAERPDIGGVVVASALAGEPDWLYPIALGMVVTRPQFCAQRRDTCLRMGQAMKTGLAFVHQHPPESFAILQHHYDKIDPALLRQAFESLQKMLAQSPAVTEASIANSDRLNIEAGFMKPEDARKSYAGLFTDEFVR